MRLLDKPHCKKHEVYQQNCIGCRIKAKHKPLSPEDEAFLDSVIASKPAQPRPKHQLYPPKPDHTEDAKKLLKAIYKDGAYGIRRSLQEDLETITRLLT